jgi:hypothetical protein
MLYDLAATPPEPGSLLESIFLLIATRRREAELFKTEAIVAAVVGTAAEDTEVIEKALTNFKNTMFPFLEAEKGKREEMAKKALEQWTGHTAFRVKPLWIANDSRQKRLHSQLRRSTARTQKAEEMRRHHRHTRI